jgi:hypothetical protein
MTASLPVLPTATEGPRYSSIIARPIDNTALAMYMACHWKYFAAMFLHRRKEGPPTPALGYGGAWHKVMEAHFKYVPPEHLRPHDNMSKADAIMLREAIIEDLYSHVELFAAERWEDHQAVDDHRTFRRLMLDYRAFIKRFGLSWEEQGKTLGWPDAPVVEKAIELAIPGARHPYTGKLDRAYTDQAQFFIDDHKTSAYKINYADYTLDNQMMGYASLGWLLTGQVIAGVRIRGVVIHKGETIFELPRVIPFGKERLKAWMENLDSWFGDIENRIHYYRGLEKLGHPDPGSAAFPRNHAACAGKYGLCTYAGICSLSPEIRMRALEDDFGIAPWNPLENEDVAAE